jgi:L-fuconate dehydratase
MSKKVFDPKKFTGITINSIIAKDIRFPTSLEQHGSDAMHTDPDYSCAYVIIKCSGTDLQGHGLTFTIGKGTEVVVKACESLSQLILNVSLDEIAKDFRSFLRSLTCHSQMRWLGPEKGVMHLATGAIVNALWDLFAKIERMPLWKLLTEMTPEQIISICDFTYLTDAISEQEALEILREAAKTKHLRENEMVKSGYPVYITSAGWLGYTDDEVRTRVHDALSKGFNKFKIKVGQNLESDINRCNYLRKLIGWNNTLMVDANQRWEVQEAIDWMMHLKDSKPLWIEEPTSPDDIKGHKKISNALNPYGIRVASGEHCQNRIIFKQLITQNAIQFVQIDSCRLAGPSEIIPVLLMAKKYNVPVCPHAGGVGLCEYVQHLCMFDYIYVAGSLEDRFTEFADHLHEHFLDPPCVKNSCYQLPKLPGYSGQIKEQSLVDYEFPNGSVWQNLRK